MRLLLLLVLLAPATAWGQSAEQPRVTLSVTVSEAMLLVQTLGQIECRTVAQLATCEAAASLLKTIRDQAKTQVP